MRKLKIIAIVCLFASLANAKGKRIETFFGFNATSYVNVGFNSSQPSTKKLGFNSFSYSSSLEQRFSVHNKLKFSLQYSLTYFNMNMQQLQQTIAKHAKTKELSTGMGVQAIYQFRKDACVVTGFTLNKPVYTCFKAELPSESSPAFTSISQQRFSLQDSRSWNPTFNVGFEKQFNLFNRPMRYTLQYQLGYMSRNPYMPSYASPTYMHGVSFGLKYKL